MENNSFYLDIKTFEYHVYNRVVTDGRMRLYLGEFINGDFKTTVDTIQELDIDIQNSIKDFIREEWPHLKNQFSDVEKTISGGIPRA